MQDNKIKISIILAVYNCAKYLKESIDSILNQTFAEFELILINDGSTDLTDTIITQYTDKRIVYVKNETNLGLIDSLNKGILLSRGKYIARMDADDITLPDRLKVQCHFMDTHPEIGICGSSVDAFWVSTGKYQRIDYATTDLSIRAFTFFQSPFCHPTVMIRKEVLNQYFLNYSKDYYLAEDYALWVAMLAHTKAANIPQVLLHYRKHEDSETAVADRQQNGRLNVVKKVITLYLEQQGIVLDEDSMMIYTSFTDRSFCCELQPKNQKEIDKVLSHFLHQLTTSHPELVVPAKHYLSVNSFYKFFSAKKLPLTRLLIALCLQGGLIYFKRLITNGK